MNACPLTLDTPGKLTGKEFEELILFRGRKLAEDGVLTLDKYGVQSTYRTDPQTGKLAWQPMQSYPDFDGCIAPNGREFIIEAKVCSAASLPLTQQGKSVKLKQLTHMFQRSRFGSLCLLMIHWNRRELKTRVDEAATYALPVIEDHPLWASYLREEVKTLTRQQCELYGVEVPWRAYQGGRKLTPAIEVAVGVEVGAW